MPFWVNLNQLLNYCQTYYYPTIYLLLNIPLINIDIKLISYHIPFGMTPLSVSTGALVTASPAESDGAPFTDAGG